MCYRVSNDTSTVAVTTNLCKIKYLSSHIYSMSDEYFFVTGKKIYPVVLFILTTVLSMFSCLHKLCTAMSRWYLSRCPMPTLAFSFAAHEYWMEFDKIFGRRSPLTHFGQHCTRDKGAGYDWKFESTSHQCRHLANAEASYDCMVFSSLVADENGEYRTVEKQYQISETQWTVTVYFKIPNKLCWQIGSNWCPKLLPQDW